MKGQILGKKDGALIVIGQHPFLYRLPQLIQKPLQPFHLFCCFWTTIYLVSIVDSATIFSAAILLSL